MSDDLRARIADAYHSVQSTDYKFTTDRAVVARDVANGRIDAILAALPEADRDEVADRVVLPVLDEIPGRGGDWKNVKYAAAIVDALLSRYHLIPKEA